jgi:hypothetical protein
VLGAATNRVLKTLNFSCFNAACFAYGPHYGPQFIQLDQKIFAVTLCLNCKLKPDFDWSSSQSGHCNLEFPSFRHRLANQTVTSNGGICPYQGNGPKMRSLTALGAMISLNRTRDFAPMFCDHPARLPMIAPPPSWRGRQSVIASAGDTPFTT